MTDCYPFRRISSTVVLDASTRCRHVECERCSRIVAVFDPDLDHHWTEAALAAGDVRLLESETHICADCRRLCAPEELTGGCEHVRMATLEVYPGFTRCQCRDCGHPWLTHQPKALHGRWIQPTRDRGLETTAAPESTTAAESAGRE